MDFVSPAEAQSDGIDVDDAAWTTGVEQWREAVRAITGNLVEVIETGRAQIAEKLPGTQPLWRDVARDGVVVQGAALGELQGTVRA